MFPRFLMEFHINNIGSCFGFYQLKYIQYRYVDTPPFYSYYNFILYCFIWLRLKSIQHHHNNICPSTDGHNAARIGIWISA